MGVAPTNPLEPPVSGFLPDVAVVDSQECFPLSYAQESLWFVEQLSPGTPTYNLPEAWVLQGQVDPPLLQEALDETVRRHEVLRTMFRARNGKPEQVVLASAALQLKQVDLRGVTDTATQLDERLSLEARIPFDLSRAPLARVTLFDTASDHHVLFLNLHHLISDASSQSILIHELFSRYTSKVLRQPCKLPALPIQFADFCLWQRDLLNSEIGQNHLAFWRRKLGVLPGATLLYPDRPRGDTLVHRGTTHFVKLPTSLKDALKELGRRESVTIFITLLAAFKALLHRYTLEEQIVVGVPMACRERVDLENLIGFFVHTQALSVDLNGDPTFLELIKRVREGVLEASEHQEVPCELALQRLPGGRASSGHPLFQCVFGWQGSSTDALKASGLTARKLELETGTAKFDWTILVTEVQDGLALRSEFNSDLFEPQTMIRMLRQFQVLLENVTRHPARRISELELQTPLQKEALVKLGIPPSAEYEHESRIHEVFEKQASKSPASVAVEFGQRCFTYDELNRRANQLANFLRDCGVKSGTKVGLWLDRSIELIVSILGILKAGASYVPLDPELPGDRVKILLGDCGACALVTNSRWVPCLYPSQSIPCLVLVDADQDKITAANTENPNSNGNSTNLAYVMYTSGTTGMPKGVLVSHRAVVRLVRNSNYLDFSSDLVFLQYAPISFDASTFEIWGALLNGARLVVAEAGILSLSQLARTIQEQHVSTVWLTAGLFNQMVDHHLQDLRRVKHLLTGGEILSPQHVSKVLQGLPGCQLINGYGPTENTTFTCCYSLSGAWQPNRSVPIGRPVSNTFVYVLDKNMVPVPVGVPGELYAGGDGLAEGYLNRPELTAERFVPNPFESQQGSRLYRTGDLVRWSPEGILEFLERIDDEVKIRGHRVEPSEIENELTQLPFVESSAVTTRKDKSGSNQLVAYVVMCPEGTVGAEQVRKMLRAKLPPYAVPTQIFVVNELPLTANGKVDRRALAERSWPEATQERPLAAPKTLTESQLLEVWREVLDRREIGVDEDFFELGGHSLLATQIISRISRVFNRDLAVGAIFETPTVEQLAATIDATTPTHECLAVHQSMDFERAADLLSRLDEFSEAELDRLLQETELQSRL
jgi:amino acid adenylation domain-containing protein